MSGTIRKSSLYSCIIGDATQPAVSIESGGVIICHVCNDIGLWGKGFVVPLGKKYPQAKESYLEKHDTNNLRLGETDIVHVSKTDSGKDIYVANMVAQHRVRSKREPTYVPFRLEAFQSCLNTVYQFAASQSPKLEIAGPMMGSGLAGGNWHEIERELQIRAEVWGVVTTIYKLEE